MGHYRDSLPRLMAKVNEDARIAEIRRKFKAAFAGTFEDEVSEQMADRFVGDKAQPEFLLSDEQQAQALARGEKLRMRPRKEDQASPESMAMLNEALRIKDTP